MVDCWVLFGSAFGTGCDYAREWVCDAVGVVYFWGCGRCVLQLCDQVEVLVAG